MKVIGLLLCAVLSAASQEQAEAFRQLTFIAADATSFGAYSFRLAEPDRADKPTAWQGPLTISSGGKSCEADVSLVTAVYASPDMPFVVVITYSGSNTYVHFITSSTCASRWESIKAFTEGVRVVADRLSILPACEGSGNRSPARCFAGRVYKLTTTAPQLLRSESLQLTKESLGVGFTGQAMVAHPRSAAAHIVTAK